MYVGRALLRRVFSDDRRKHDERRLIGALFRLFSQFNNVFRFVHRTFQNLPAVRFVALFDIIGKSDIGRTVYADFIFVVKYDELSELQVSRETRRFGRNAFLETAFADERIRIVIDYFTRSRIESSGKHRFRDCRADRHRHTLSERAARVFNAVRRAVFGVTRTLRTYLAKTLYVVERHFVAREVQNRLQPHRAVSRGNQKTVAVCPFRVGGIVL